jgi:hypothetical protein
VSYEIRLDELGPGSSYSTVLIAEDGHRSIHWGSASRGKLRGIVTVKIGFLSITVDEEVVGKKRMHALRTTFGTDKKVDPEMLQSTTPTDRFDAATAAVTVGHFEIAAAIDPLALFDLIVIEVFYALKAAMTFEHLIGLINAAMQEIKVEKERAHDQGVHDAKRELREWLGLLGRSTYS